MRGVVVTNQLTAVCTRKQFLFLVVFLKTQGQCLIERKEHMKMDNKHHGNSYRMNGVLMSYACFLCMNFQAYCSIETTIFQSICLLK